MPCMSCTINHTQLVWINLGLSGLGLSKEHQLHHFGLYKSWTQLNLVLFIAKTLHKFRLKMGLINLDPNNQEPHQSNIGWPLGIPWRFSAN